MAEKTIPLSPLEVLEAYERGPVGRITTITAEDVTALKKMITNHAGIKQTARYLVESFPRRCEQLVGWSMFDAIKNNENKTQVLIERLAKLLTKAAGLTE